MYITTDLKYVVLYFLKKNEKIIAILLNHVRHGSEDQTNYCP